MKERIRRFINSGHSRTIKAKRNILYLFGIKGISILINLAYVPLLIDTLGNEEYGIWLVLTSFISWMSFFDIGIGNGTRNYLAHALAKQDYQLAKSYVSTTYALFICIFIPLVFLIIVLSPLVNWSIIFNTRTVHSESLLLLTIITLCFFSLRFIVQTINIVLLADQRPAMSSFINMTFNIVNILTILLLNRLSINSLLLSGSILSSVPVVVLLVFSFFLYNKNYRKIAPSTKFVNFKLSGSILTLGLKFFTIQVSGIVIYSSTNLLITQFINPSAVTSYNVAFKYFSIITMIYGILMAPFWSSVTNAYSLGDLKWIRQALSKYAWVSVILSICIFFMLILSPKAYYLWVGNKVLVPFPLSIIISIQTLMYVWLSPYVAFLNGVGKIQLASYFVIIQSLLFIPLIFILVKVFEFGIIGIVLASILLEIPLKTFQVLQFNKIITGSARGIWNK